MNAEFLNAADDFFINLNLQTVLNLPDSRETILHFCEAVQKEFRSMNSFHQRDTGEYVLEGDRESGSYRWMELQSHSISAGFFNPPSVDDVYRMHDWLLERSLYYLGVNGLDVECMDVLFGFNFEYKGNRDAIVAQALLDESPLANLAGDQEFKPLEFEPNMVFSLDEECYLQARLSLETRTNSFQARSGRYDEEPISVYFTVRQYSQPNRVIDIRKSFGNQAGICEDYCRRLVIPNVVRPIATEITTAR